MSIINSFKEPVREEFTNYKTFYKNSLKSKTKILDFISTFVHKRKENEIIPLLTILSAKLSGKVTENTYVAASIIDFLSTATIIHDDVSEEPLEKNDIFRINSLWQSKLSVLMGDYFLAKGLLLSVKTKSYNLLEIISKAVKEITEGELYKIYYSRKLNITRNEYFEIVNKKSVSLMSACTSVGAISANADENVIKSLYNFGCNYGIVYHIKKDIETVNGKKYSKTINLPLILALENSTEAERNEFFNKDISLYNKQEFKNLNAFIKAKGGIESSKNIMNEYIEKAIKDLSAFEPTETREVLIRLARA